MEIRDQIKDYWKDPDTRSLIDENLRKLEEGIVIHYAEPGSEIIDIGCGDGYSTFQYASHVKRCVGVESSDYLLDKARQKLSEISLTNTEIRAGDIMDLKDYKQQFDLAVTQRVLINLPSWEHQKKAIENVRAVLRPGGIYVMIENTFEGHDVMNEYRAALGLRKISRHWHNLYFHHDQLMEFLRNRFHLVGHHTFGLYYLLTRVFMNKIACFEGFGKDAVKDPIFSKADAAARKIQEQFGDQVTIGSHPSFGAIQGFALRKLTDQ